MDRRAFMLTVAGGLVIARPVARAQPVPKVYRIGFLAGTPRPRRCVSGRDSFKGCGSWGTFRVRTSSLKVDITRAESNDSPPLQRS